MSIKNVKTLHRWLAFILGIFVVFQVTSGSIAAESRLLMQWFYPEKYQVRWVPTTAMLVDAFTKHLVDQTVLTDFMSNGIYSLREDPRLEEARNKARADRKAKAKAKAKGSTTPSTR